jgi:hypothetical protein
MTNPEPVAAPKRPYVAPALKVYGTLADLTQRVSLKGKSDGSVFVFVRTGGG